MQFPMRVIAVSAGFFVFIIIFGFIAFPKMITGKVKGMVNLKPGSEIRGMFLNVPFALDFNVYIFSVQNPDEVQNGGTPKLKEVGPFCFEEWKSKINVQDNEGDDTITYEPVDLFLKARKPAAYCLTGEEEVTIPHPMILGMVNTVQRQKPGALTLANKAIKSIYDNPSSLFVKVRAMDLLFDGVIIHCGVKDFAGKAICTSLRAEPSLRKVNDEDLAFSFFGPKNGTAGKKITAYRGVQDSHNVGKIVIYDGKRKQEIWNGSTCDAILGTDGTIFPPFLKPEEGLMSFAPDLCRSLGAVYEKKEKYDNIPVRAYYATFGDQSKNADEKCFCTTPDTCMKKGLIDLYKCSGVPVYASLPHFYESDESYLKGVSGLKPDKEKHGIRILFEAGVSLNITYTKQLKDFFTIKKVVAVTKYVILVCSLVGLGAGGYLYFNQAHKLSPVHKVQPVDHPKSANSAMFNENGKENGFNDYKSETY